MADGLLEASEHAGPSILAKHRPSNEPVQFPVSAAQGGAALFSAASTPLFVLLNRKNCRVCDMHHKLSFLKKMQVVVQKKQDQIVLEPCYVSTGDQWQGMLQKRATQVHEKRL
jgi:hypothetical protein